MVDFKKENARKYIPKNFSFDSNFKRYYEDSLFLQALCEIRNSKDSKEPSCTCLTAANNATSALHYKNTNCSPSKTYSAHLSHERSADFFAALDLASTPNNNNSYSPPSKSNIQATKSNENKWTKMGDRVVVSDTESSLTDTANDGTDNNTGKDVLKSATHRSQSPTVSDTDTDFSEDYMRMTDAGDSASARSDTPDSLTRTSRFSSTSSYDSTLSFSNRSSVDTIDDDIDRVTLNLTKNMEISPDDDPIKRMNDQLENSISNLQKNDHEVDNTKKTLGLARKRIKEKELPKIKLLLSKSKSPPTDEMFEKGLTSFPSGDSDSLSDGDSPTPAGGSLFVNQEFDFLETEHVKRSTSLKTYKTPPGTPHRKKVVRFADAMGLDLEDVKHVMNTDDPPHIPDSAMRDLKVSIIFLT